MNFKEILLNELNELLINKVKCDLNTISLINGINLDIDKSEIDLYIFLCYITNLKLDINKCNDNNMNNQIGIKIYYDVFENFRYTLTIKQYYMLDYILFNNKKIFFLKNIIIKDSLSNIFKDKKSNYTIKILAGFIEIKNKDNLVYFNKLTNSYNNKAILRINNKCNNNCIFCHAYNIFQNNTFESNINKIMQLEKININTLLFSGGEPTIDKNLFLYINYLKKHNINWGLNTNLRLFSNKAFLKKIFDLNPEIIFTSIHSSQKEVFNKITENNLSFNQTFNALTNIKKIDPNFPIVINIVVNKINYKYLKQTYKFLYENYKDNIHTIRLSMLIPEKKTIMMKQKLLQHPLKIIKEIQECIDFIISINPDQTVYIENTPLCILDEKYHKYIYDFSYDKITHISNCNEYGFFKVDNGTKTKHMFCADCKYSKFCLGVFKEYIDIFGISSFIPYDGFTYSKKIPNSFILEYLSQADNLNNIKKIYKNKKHGVILKENEKFSYFVDNDCMFSKNIKKKILDKEQIYININFNKVQTANFSNDFRKLKCIGNYKIQTNKTNNYLKIYEIDKKNIFKNDDKKVLKIIDSLEGSILDIGFGECFYKNKIKEKLIQKKIKYFGVEPDKKLFHNMQKSFLKFADVSLFNCNFEEFNNSYQNKFDYILVLRSLNHLKDIKMCFDNIHKMLKKNGKALIVDNCIYAQIISEKQVNDDKKADFEHYRNYDLSDFLEFINKHYKFQNIKIIDRITNKSSNQWGVILTK